MWKGSGSAETAPSPKLHEWLVISPVEELAKATVSGACPEVGVAMMPATGVATGSLVVMVSTAVRVPLGPATARTTVKVPAVV